MKPLSELPIAELAEGICLLAGRIAAAEAELLHWIAEFDRREGWAEPGMLSCAHWLSWRTGLSSGAARERVRVARRLADVPEVAAAFAEGVVSFSKVRAITRVAEPDDGVNWVELARNASAAQLDKVVRGVERVRANELAMADPAAAEWSLRTTLRYDEHGNFTMTVRGPAQYALLVRAGLDAKRAELQRQRDAEVASVEPVAAPETQDDGESVTEIEPVTDAEALMAMAQDALATEAHEHPATSRRRRPQLTVLRDPLSGWGRQPDGELLPPSAFDAAESAMLASAPHLRAVPDLDLCRFDLDRSQREVSDRLREQLGVIDGERCRFPGCTRRRKLHGHHVIYWSQGGPTDLANLVLLCSRHHTIVHTQGFELILHPDRRLEVRTAEGVAVVHHPAQPWGSAADCGKAVPAETLSPQDATGRMDLHYVVSVLMAQSA